MRRYYSMIAALLMAAVLPLASGIANARTINQSAAACYPVKTGTSTADKNAMAGARFGFNDGWKNTNSSGNNLTVICRIPNFEDFAVENLKSIVVHVTGSASARLFASVAYGNSWQGTSVNAAGSGNNKTITLTPKSVSAGDSPWNEMGVKVVLPPGASVRGIVFSDT
jgi:hypothetical protein